MNTIFGPNRQSIRLRTYDYGSVGAYYVTLCTDNREELFGSVQNGEMVRSSLGEMIHRAWMDLPTYHPRISLDEFIVMPNHLHGIILLNTSPDGPDFGRGWNPAPTITLSSVIGRFKSWTTRRYLQDAANGGWLAKNRRLWQRNYYEHIVRDDGDLARIREYIRNNPRQWALDLKEPA